MSKALILSDLHLEFEQDNAYTMRLRKVHGVDFLILAGDVGNFYHHLDFIKDCATKYTVLYILGNHEFYGHRISEVTDFWNSVDIPNFYFLDNKTVVLNGIRFIGSTLWTDYNRGHPMVMYDAKGVMNDFKKIKNEEKNGEIRSHQIYDLFQKNFAFLKQEVEKPFDGHTVVITHHAPSLQSIHERYKMGNYINNFYFASDLDNFIYDHDIHTWIHGHMHDAMNYMIGDKTHVVCNPRGYPHEHKFGSFEYKVIDL